MRKSQYIAKMNRIAELSKELNDAAQKDFGRDAFVFVSDDGSIQIMTGDTDGDGFADERQKFIKYSATLSHDLAIGAW